MRDSIKEGDIVVVNIHSVQLTLSLEAEVKYMPQATGDSWVFKDLATGMVHYVSEGCTVTKLGEPQ